MNNKEIIVIDESDEELLFFLEKLRAAKKLRIRLGSDVFALTMERETLSEKGRNFLVGGGPDTK